MNLYVSLEKYPEAVGVGESLVTNGVLVQRPGIVHRLDKDTSGVLLLARTPEAHALLKSQFKAHTIVKRYLAYVYGVVTDDHGSIDKPLGRSRGDFRQYTTPRKARGEMRSALTYFVTKRRGSGWSLLEVLPQTGRTHQIRAHLASIGHPIIADTVYTGGRESMLGFTRVALHALEITFKDREGKEVRVVAPLPADFLAAAQL